VDRERAAGRTLVEDALTAIMQEQEDMHSAEEMGLRTRKPETTFDEMLNAI